MMPIGSRSQIPETLRKGHRSSVGFKDTSAPKTIGNNHSTIKDTTMNRFIELRALSYPFNACATKLGKSGTFWCYASRGPGVAKRIAARRKVLINEAMLL